LLIPYVPVRELCLSGGCITPVAHRATYFPPGFVMSYNLEIGMFRWS
jgi:hypothetical protein